MTYIYLVENLSNNINEVYIGKTKTPKTRRMNHNIKYGHQIKFTIIDEINSLDKKDWEPLETYWIEQFRQWGFKLKNKNRGGGGLQKHSNTTKQKMSLSRKGKNHSEETKNKISQKNKGNIHSEEIREKIKKTKLGKPTKKSKPINQYDLEGNFIRTWNKIKEASAFVGKPLDTASITCCCRGKQKTAFGYKWKYKL